MTPRTWRSLYWPLAAATVVLCVVFWQSISRTHLGVVAGLGVLAPIVMAWLGGRLTQEIEPPAVRSATDGRVFPWFGSVLFCLACGKFAILGFLSSEFVPALHDEWSYRFGAQTLAQGRLANPTPPHPEFFDAFHILTTPRWVTRYPPGHPALLALGVLAGWPAGVVIALCAGTAVWIYLLGKELGDESVGRLAGLLAVLAPGLDFLASGYLSQTTFLFAITGCYVCAVRCVRRTSIGWAVAAGSLGGWAILTRPYSAVALGLPLGLWVVWQVTRRLGLVGESRGAPRLNGPATPVDVSASAAQPHLGYARVGLTLLSALLPLLVAFAFFAVYNVATTQHPFRTAWGEYNRQYEPDNTLGFSTGVARPIPAGLSARKMWKARSVADEKLRFTRKSALRRAATDPRRLSEMVFPAAGFYGLMAFVPFGAYSHRLRHHQPTRLWWFVVVAVASHYVAYSCFYATWGVYGHETIPLVLVLVAAGSVEFWRQARDSDRPGIAATVPLVVLAALALDAREIGRFIERRQAETKVHRDFLKKIDDIHETPAIVFVRFDPKRQHEYDLINNSPDLNSRVLVVLDRGGENAKLLEAIPGREAYLFDEANGSLTPWSPPKPDVPARRQDRRWPAVASSRQESRDR